MADWLGLHGSRVLVAGAGGIGAAVVRGFLDAGADVTVVDSDSSRLAELASSSSLDAAGGRAITIDLLEPNAPNSVVKQMIDSCGGIDVFVHCVGVNDRRPILDLSDDDWSHILGVNLTTAYRLGSAVGREMVRQQSGRIVFLSSVAGLMAHRNHAPYAVSKGGLNQLMRSMASEWADVGVRVNAIAPGYVETPLTAEHLGKPGVREALASLVPAGQLGNTEQLVGPILFLASRQAEFITGQVLYVDGGRTLV